MRYPFSKEFLPLNIFLVLTYYVCILSWGLIYFLLSFSQAWGTNTNGFFNNLLFFTRLKGRMSL